MCWEWLTHGEEKPIFVRPIKMDYRKWRENVQKACVEASRDDFLYSLVNKATESPKGLNY